LGIAAFIVGCWIYIENKNIGNILEFDVKHFKSPTAIKNYELGTMPNYKYYENDDGPVMLSPLLQPSLLKN